jgi:pentatricopeptide repeat protein
MYCKCGDLDKAQEVFEQLPLRNIVPWNALMAGYAQLGQANVVIDLYRKARMDDLVPNVVTFVALLSACSHDGLLEEGEKLFDEIQRVYHLTPALEHYTCMMDLFGRSGCFNKVYTLLDRVLYSGHLPLFLSLLGACGKWGNVTLGRWAFEQAVRLDTKCSVAYVGMKNIYAAAAMHTEANGIGGFRG